MKCYLSEPIAQSAYERLASRCEIVDTFDHPEQLDAIIVRRARVTGDVIRRATRLKIISMHGVGLDTIDVSCARACGVPVVNVPGESAESVAELAVSFMLALARRHKTIDRGLRSGSFSHFGDPAMMGTEVFGKRVGLVGGGRIATHIAQIMSSAFSAECLCYDPTKSAPELAARGMRKVDDLAELFAQADFVSVNMPLLPSTRNMINAEVLAAANPQLILVNTARGGIVDEDALYEALVHGRIRAAASDVFASEPPSPESPLLNLDNFIATLHVGGSTTEALERVSNAAVDHVLEALDAAASCAGAA